MVEPARRPDAPDPTFYPVSEKVPDPPLNRKIGVLLEQLVARWLAERGERAYVGGDQFIYWVQYQPTRAVAPDVYVLPGVDPETDVRAWKLWEYGVVPSLVVEVVGLDVRKDYELGPPRYDEIGVRELFVYDPGYAEGPERSRFQVWRRRRGELVRVDRTDADRVRSRVLGCFIREVGEGSRRRLRLATGPRAEELFPTAEEAAERGREEAEAELARVRAELEASRRR